jgi:transcriptional regulator with PAS, ATPase and Fis domain
LKTPSRASAKHDWVREFAGAITVCDPKGIILEMNDEAIRDNQEQGGKALIGTNLLDCHPEPARTKLVQLLESRQANVYTIEKNGKKKLIHQTPWYKNGKYCGFIELDLKIPHTMPHFVRD